MPKIVKYNRTSGRNGYCAIERRYAIEEDGSKWLDSRGNVRSWGTRKAARKVIRATEKAA